MVCDQNLVFSIVKHTIALICFVVFLLCKEFVEVFVGIWIPMFYK